METPIEDSQTDREQYLPGKAATMKNIIDLINNIPAGIGIGHLEKGVMYLDYANDGFFRLHRGSREYWQQFMGPEILNVVYEPDRQLFYEDFKRCQGINGNVTYRVKGEDGSLYWVNFRSRPAYVQDGIQYFYDVFTNVDEQKKAELRSEDSHRLLEEALTSSNIQHFTYYPEQHLVEIFALSKRYQVLPLRWENYPDTFLAYVRPNAEDEAAYREMVRQIDNGANEAECTIQMSYKGIYIWLKVHLTAIKDATGKTIRVHGYSVDVSNRKKEEERLRTEQMRLKSLTGGVVEAFSFNVSRNGHSQLETTLPFDYSKPVADEVVKAAEAFVSSPEEMKTKAWQVWLVVAASIPDAEERKQFMAACSTLGIKKAVREGHYQKEITYRRRIEGKLRWVKTEIEVIHDPDNGDLLAFFYTKDIHDKMIRRKINEAIAFQNYETVSYYDVLGDKIHVLSTSDVHDVNLEGLTYKRAVELTAQNIVFETDRPKFLEAYAFANIRRVLQQQNLCTIYYEKKEVRRDLPGQPRKRVMNNVFYLDKNQDILVFLLSDVTEIYEQEREHREHLAETLKAAQQASVAKTSFLSRMSHEIRTPMNAIIGLDTLTMEEPNLPPRVLDHLTKISTSAKFLLALINDILDMSRIESGRMALNLAPFCFVEFLNGINGMFVEQCRRGEIKYYCAVSKKINTAYVGDATKLQQVLVNILGNAVKFTPKGGQIQFLVEYKTGRGGKDKLQFTIGDTGCGIDKKFLPQLFEPFTQERQEITTPYGGTGLGLAISKHIIEMMGGTITVHSRKFVGTEFVVELELQPATQEQKRIILNGHVCPSLIGVKLLDTTPGEAGTRATIGVSGRVDNVVIPGKSGLQVVSLAAPAAETEYDFRGYRILLVEDNPINIEIEKALLERRSCLVETAMNGISAVEKYKQEAPGYYDAILMDIRMPVLDGLGATQMIRAAGKKDSLSIPILAMTANAFQEDIEQSLAAGMNAHLAKPVEPEKLYALLQKYLLAAAKKV